VYSRPQLKPPRGICSFTTTTFCAHRGADQGAGRSAFGWDLLRLLGGSTSASPPSTSGLLQLPGLTSTRLGRHTVVLDQHRHFRAGIFFPGRRSVSSGRHIYVSADIGGAGVDSDTLLAGICVFWPAFPTVGRQRQVLAFSGRDTKVLGRICALPAGLARVRSRLGCRCLSSTGWAGISSNPGWAGAGRILAGPARVGSPAGPAAPPSPGGPLLHCHPGSPQVSAPFGRWASAGPRPRRDSRPSRLLRQRARPPRRIFSLITPRTTRPTLLFIWPECEAPGRRRQHKVCDRAASLSYQQVLQTSPAIYASKYLY
jgi:hypothetical protein